MKPAPEHLLVEGIGPVRVLRVLDSLDGPKIVGVRADTGQVFLAYWLEQLADKERWLFLPTSEERYADLLGGRLDLRGALLSPELGSLAEVHFSKHGASLFAWHLPTALPDLELLPSADEFVESVAGQPDEDLIPPDTFRTRA